MDREGEWMEREINIDVNIDCASAHDDRRDAARLILVRARGFTRDGGAPTITNDCTGYPALESEAQRLKTEIDDALARARVHFEGRKAEDVVAERRSPTRSEKAAARPHFETGLKVRDVMTRDVRTVNLNDRLSVADELMKLGGFRHVVVIDDAGTVTGVVSGRDIFHGALAWSLGLGQSAHEKSLAAYPVKQVMATDVVTVAPDAELREAAKLMLEKKIGCIPVVDGGQLIGIITEADILATLTGTA